MCAPTQYPLAQTKYYENLLKYVGTVSKFAGVKMYFQHTIHTYDAHFIVPFLSFS